jgi:hypothetical protein
MRRSRITLVFAEDREELGCCSQTANKQKPTDQVGSGNTLPPRSTAVGVISLSAVWGDSFPTNIDYHRSRLRASACLLCGHNADSSAWFPCWRNLRLMTSAEHLVSRHDQCPMSQKELRFRALRKPLVTRLRTAVLGAVAHAERLRSHRFRLGVNPMVSRSPRIRNLEGQSRSTSRHAIGA